jgi:hypothetical protein
VTTDLCPALPAAAATCAPEWMPRCASALTTTQPRSGRCSGYPPSSTVALDNPYPLATEAA